jgi:hypothetical protein
MIEVVLNWMLVTIMLPFFIIALFLLAYLIASAADYFGSRAVDIKKKLQWANR